MARNQLSIPQGGRFNVEYLETLNERLLEINLKKITPQKLQD